MRSKTSHVGSLTPPKSSPLLLCPLGLLPGLVGFGLPFSHLGLERLVDLGWGRWGWSRLCGDDVSQLLWYIEDPSGNGGLRSHFHFLPIPFIFHREGQGVWPGGKNRVLQRHDLWLCACAYDKYISLILISSLWQNLSSGCWLDHLFACPKPRIWEETRMISQQFNHDYLFFLSFFTPVKQVCTTDYQTPLQISETQHIYPSV